MYQILMPIPQATLHEQVPFFNRKGPDHSPYCRQIGVLPRDDAALMIHGKRVLAEPLNGIRGVGWTCSHRRLEYVYVMNDERQLPALRS